MFATKGRYYSQSRHLADICKRIDAQSSTQSTVSAKSQQIKMVKCNWWSWHLSMRYPCALTCRALASRGPNHSHGTCVYVPVCTLSHRITCPAQGQMYLTVSMDTGTSVHILYFFSKCGNKVIKKSEKYLLKTHAYEAQDQHATPRHPKCPRFSKSTFFLFSFLYLPLFPF